MFDENLVSRFQFLGDPDPAVLCTPPPIFIVFDVLQAESHDVRRLPLERRRQVPLNDAADAVLARRGPKDSGLVFGSSNWNRYRSAWERTVTRAKLTDQHWHDLRHTFASWAVQRRVSLYELKELLGHASLTMVKRCAHLAPEHLRAAAAALDGVLTADTELSATARRQQADRERVLSAS